eukprot:9074646-Pyramimonas_sp.AAC.1
MLGCKVSTSSNALVQTSCPNLPKSRLKRLSSVWPIVGAIQRSTRLLHSVIHKCLIDMAGLSSQVVGSFCPAPSTPRASAMAARMRTP